MSMYVVLYLGFNIDVEKGAECRVFQIVSGSEGEIDIVDRREQKIRNRRQTRYDPIHPEKEGEFISQDQEDIRLAKFLHIQRWSLNLMA